MGLITLAKGSPTVSIIFADLELILLGVKTLEHLKLAGGLEDPDRRDLVPAEAYEARLRTFKLTSRKAPRGPRQICWILRPAVDSLRVLHVEVHVGGPVSSARSNSIMPSLTVDAARSLARSRYSCVRECACCLRAHASFSGSRYQRNRRST